MPTKSRRGPRFRSPPGVPRDDLIKAILAGWHEAKAEGTPEQIEDFLRDEHPEVYNPLKVDRGIEARFELYRRLNPYRERAEPVLFELIVPNGGVLKIVEVTQIHPDGSHQRLTKKEATEHLGSPRSDDRTEKGPSALTDAPELLPLVQALTGIRPSITSFEVIEPRVKQVLRTAASSALSARDRATLRTALLIRAHMLETGVEPIKGLASGFKRRRLVRRAFALLQDLEKLPEASHGSSTDRGTGGSSTYVYRFVR